MLFMRFPATKTRTTQEETRGERRKNGNENEIIAARESLKCLWPHSGGKSREEIVAGGGGM